MRNFFSFLLSFIMILTFSDSIFDGSSYQDETVESYKDWLNCKIVCRIYNSIEAQNFIT